MRRSDRSNKASKYITAIVIALVISVLLGFLLDIVITKIEYKAYKKPDEYAQYIEKYSEKYDVPEHVIYSVIKAESGFDRKAESGAGAIGLMQMMPDTFEELTDIHFKEYLDVSMLYDAETSIRYGTFYLSYLYGIYGEWSVVFAAYNAGPGNVRDWLEDETYSSDGKTLDKIPFKETRNYVSRVNRYIEKYDELYNEK